MRVLIAIRQSKRRELSESPETQRRDIAAWAAQQGHEVIGEAVDVGVSASVPPDRRPELGPWLTDPQKLAEWDILAVWKIDRAVRSATHFWGDLVPMLTELGKSVVAVTEGVNTLTTSATELGFRVGMAQDELSRLRDRARASRAALRRAARYAGGPPPFGYYAVKTPEGYKLAIDPEAQEAIVSVIGLLRQGYTLNYCVSYLNQEGVLTAWDRHAVRMGRKPKGRPWRRKTLHDTLRRRHLLGQYVHRGEVVRDDEGNPRMIGEPMLTRAEWDELQALINRPPKTYRVRGQSMLRGVAYCNGCGRPMVHHPGGKKDVPRYVCSVRALPGVTDCWAAGYPAEALEDFVESAFLEDYGDLPVIEVDAVPVLDHSARLAEIAEALDQLETDRYIHGRFTGDDGERRFHRLYSSLEAERDELMAQQSATPGIRSTPTGKTYRDLWQAADNEERGEILRKFGVYVMAQWRKTRGDLPLAVYTHLYFPLADGL